MRLAYLIFTMLLLSFFSNAQEEELLSLFSEMERLESKRDIDSLGIMAPTFLKAAQQYPKSDYYIWAQHYYGLFRWRQEPDTCLALALQSHESFKRENIFLGKVKSALSLGVINFNFANDVPLSSQYYNYGLSLLERRGAKELGDSIASNLLSLFYNSLSTNRAEVGDYELATELALKAKSSIIKYENDRQEALVLMNLANINASLKNYEQSQVYNKELLALCKKMGDQEFLSMVLNNLAANHGNRGDLDSALYYLKEGYELAKADENWKQMCLRAANIGFSYQRLQDYKQARSYYEEALRLANEYKIPQRKITVLHFIASLDLLEENSEAALPRILEAKTLIEQGGRKELLLQSYDLLHNVYKMEGDYKLGLDYYQKMTSLRDSLRGEKVKQQVQSLQDKYEEVEFAKLIRENELAQLKVRQRNILIGVTVGLFSFISLIIFLIGRQRALREKQQSIINAQKLRRAQMNPHFFFNALTSIQSLILDSNDKQKQLTYIGRFASLMRQTLEQSFEEFIPLEEEMASLENYLNLQQLRFEDRFEYEIDYDPEDLENLEVPSQMVQSLVENAIEHGFKGIDYLGKLTIRLKRERDQVFRIEVEDNGRGLNPSESNHISRSQQILRDRLSLFKEPNKYFFKLENARQKGVRATVFAPYQML